MFFTLDPPSAPLQPKFFPKTLTSAILFWISPTDSVCDSRYIIHLNNILEGNASYVHNTTTNATNMTVSDLTQGAEYSFTVAGVDAGGRVGEESDSSNIVTLDGESYKI